MHISDSSPARGPARHDHIRVAVAALCALLAAANAAFEPELARGLSLSVVPALLMIATLLCGWQLATLCATAVVLENVLWPPPDVWFAVSSAAMAVVCGEALRRGARPLLICAVQLTVTLAGSIPLLAGGVNSNTLSLVTSAAAHTGINVALATAALVLMPRRSDRFPPRCRTRWDHIVFALVVGTVSITTLGLLAGHQDEAIAPQAGLRASEAVSVRLCVLVAFALAFSYALTRWCEAASRALMARYKASSQTPAQSGRPLQWQDLPLEVAGFFLDLTRETQHLRRGAERHDRDLLDARETLKTTQQELQRTRGLLGQKSAELRERISSEDSVREQLRLLLEMSVDAAIFVAPDGTIQMASPSVAKNLGYQPAALQGEALSVLVPADCILDHPLDLSTPLSGPRSAEALVKTASGPSCRMQVEVHPFQDRGQQRHLVKLSAAAAGSAATAATPANPSRDVLIATMSHELRTPLHGLIATLDMLRVSDPSTGDFQRQLSIARTSARALLKIANDVLDLTRIGSGVFNLERKNFALTNILREIIDEARARASSYGLAVSVQMADALPPSFIGDPARLKQILGNLVSNALKFTASGGVTVRVQYDGRVSTIDVEDTGEGIPPDKRESIFSPFVQLESRSGRQVGGTGLGLPISRRLAEAMGGQLVLLRSGPRGSVFRVTLSLEASEEPPPDEQSQRVFKNPKGRVLVVEDNPANRYVAEALLTGLKCPVTIVSSGPEALELLQRREFDLILMDCQMPGMDGYETTRRARHLLKRKVPIIAMTANAMADDRNSCLEAGMDDFLPKPFGRQALNAVLCKWLTTAGTASVRSSASLEAGMQTLAVLDQSVLKELWTGLQCRPGRLQQIGTTFRESAERTLPLLESNRQGDRSALLRQLHTMLGSSGMVGARQVEYFAGRIQAALKANRRDDLVGAGEILRRAIHRYEKEFDRTLRELGAERDTVGTDRWAMG